VLVISPFAASIASQYRKRAELWDDARTLPTFSLETIRAPLSAGLVPPDSASWFEALDEMKAAMDGLRYDVMLVGAGAFSLPLAAHARRSGKVAVHLGGGLQIMFGIVGQRWRTREDFAWMFNDSWRVPAPEETPEGNRKVEGGCYW